MKSIVAGCALLAVFAAGIVVGQNKFGQPKSVLHIITVKWKAESTPEQQQKALDGVKTMAAKIPGITNVYLRTIKVQPGDYNNVIVMEFKDEAAFAAYADHPAHREWEQIYIPIRGESRSHDVSN
ncbi:MAG: Dabb family protein [Acidobacteriota bacterium]|nr:MAG: Dabb family protein [Acidobacteriota bacterium]